MAAPGPYLRLMAKLDKYIPQKFLPLWQHPAGKCFKIDYVYNI